MDEILTLNNPPIAQQTEHLGLPLPVAGNPLHYDLGALRAALAILDAAVYSSASGAAVAALQGVVDGIINGAPANLNTLQKIASALGGDPAFAATLAAQISGLQTSVDGKLSNLPATATRLGGVKVGGGLSVDAAGLLSLAAIAFSSLTGKPTTLAGYGITDGAAKATTLAGYGITDGAQKATTLAGYGITDGAQKATTLAGYGITDSAMRLAPAIKTGAFTADNGGVYLCDMSGGAFSAAMPSNPLPGWSVTFIDAASKFDAANLTLARNGKNFFSTAENYILDQKDRGRSFVFINNTIGWIIYA